MQIMCENCRTKYDLSSHTEASGACPYCAHVSHAAVRNQHSPVAGAPPASARASHARPTSEGQEDYGMRTMIFPPEAETKPDPDTSIRRATVGKKPSLSPNRRFELVVVEGNQAGHRFVIDAPRIIIGRGESADIILKDPEVSREHCAIEAYGETLILRDLRSANGTVLNGFLTRKNILKVADRIHVGNTTLELALQGNGTTGRNASTGDRKG